MGLELGKRWFVCGESRALYDLWASQYYGQEPCGAAELKDTCRTQEDEKVFFF